MQRLEARLRSSPPRTATLPAEHAGATIAAGGKRLRPLLVFLAAGPCETEHDGVVRAAVAVELVHSATLVHDDVLDAAALRRGRPTVVAAPAATWRPRPATFFSRAFAELARNGRADEVRGRSAPLGARPRRAPAARGRLERRSRSSATCTAASSRPRAFSRRPPARRAGGRRRGRGARRVRPAHRPGLPVLDDVLDVSGPAERTGKHRGTDLLDGTVTLPLILARERDPELRAGPARGETPEQAEEVCERSLATGALEEARAEALELVGGAKV